MKSHTCIYNRKCWCGAGDSINLAFSERKRFNKTLMREFSTYAEGEKYGKTKGLACIGNEQVENVFKKEKQDFQPIIMDEFKKHKAGFYKRG